MNRGEIGRREFGRATADRGPVATARVREASPVLADGVEQFIFADVFSRSGLPARERELLTVAVLAAIGGADNQLGVHVPAALVCGADPDELIQLCEQIAPYAGFPRALNALRAVRSVLEEQQLPLPLAVAEVALRDHTTLVSEVGSGDDGIVFLHAPGLDRQMWRELVRVLPEGTHAIATDLRGAGAAVGAPSPESLNQMIDDLIAIMDARGLVRAHVVTQGVSAVLGCALAAREPERVTRLGLIGPRIQMNDAPPEPRDLAAQMSATVLAQDPWAARYARDRFARCDVAGWAGLAAVLKSPMTGLPSGIPVTVAIGDNDLLVDRIWVAEVFGRDRLIEIVGGAHLAPLEVPTACANALGIGA
jgi:3-oxoadipate enol-lactonase